MPAFGNLSVKKFDGTTAVTLTGIQPSAGNDPAVWRDQSSGSSAAFQPQMTYSFRKSGSGDAMRVNVKFTVPQTYTESTTGLMKVANKAIFTVDGVIPMSMPESAVKDALAELAYALLPAAGTLSLAFATGTGVI